MSMTLRTTKALMTTFDCKYLLLSGNVPVAGGSAGVDEEVDTCDLLCHNCHHPKT